MARWREAHHEQTDTNSAQDERSPSRMSMYASFCLLKLRLSWPSHLLTEQVQQRERERDREIERERESE